MKARTGIFVATALLAANASYSSEIGERVTSTDAVYAEHVGSSFSLQAVRGDADSESMIVINRTTTRIAIYDMNQRRIAIIKPGVAIDLGSVIDDLPEFVSVSRVDTAEAHYLELQRGSVITANAIDARSAI